MESKYDKIRDEYNLVSSTGPHEIQLQLVVYFKNRIYNQGKEDFSPPVTACVSSTGVCITHTVKI